MSWPGDEMPQAAFGGWIGLVVLLSALLACSSGNQGKDGGLDGDGGVDGGGCENAYPGQVIITEIMLSPLTAIAQVGRYLELYNTSGETLVMRGWALVDGNNAAADLELPAGVVFSPHAHLVLGFDPASGSDAGFVPDAILSGLDLTAGKVTIRAADLVVDEVDYSGSGWVLPEGASLNLDPDAYDPGSNDLSGNWCASSAAFGAGGKGTPGDPNEDCQAIENCGNDRFDEGEQCDDGADGDELDGCRDDCRYSCNDPAVDCFDPPGDCQRSVCVANQTGWICGQEDDNEDTPGTDNPCLTGTCDQGVPVGQTAPDGTACDNESGMVGDNCKDGTCQEAECGDHVRGPLEQCDDGNTESGDGCSENCLLEHCGDGQDDEFEDCDDGADGDPDDGCRDECRYTCVDAAIDCSDTAGDCHTPVCTANLIGKVCQALIDTADIPQDGDPCTEDVCSPTGVPTNPASENGLACDNGYGATGDYCVSGICSEARCGDGVQGPLEICDDGNLILEDGCDLNCVIDACGDGQPDPGEECDDGDPDTCDGCSPGCQAIPGGCGDGFVCPPEMCDDGNTADGDGCSHDCQAEDAACPDDMILMPADPELSVDAGFCMDRFEASRPDATFTSMGVETSRAVSRPNVIPWYVSSMNASVLNQFQVACQAAGKRLCSKQEWYSACTGPQRTTYSFGNVFDEGICNGVNTFCADWCLANGIAPCDTSSSCGYKYYCFHPVPTGQFPDCTNFRGARDVNGNVWEIVPSTTDPRGYEVRGGAFNCGGPATRLQCAFNANWDLLYAGFRCCKSPD